MSVRPIVLLGDPRLRLKGQPVDEILKGERRGIPAWTLTREYRSTFRGELRPYQLDGFQWLVRLERPL